MRYLSSLACGRGRVEGSIALSQRKRERGKSMTIERNREGAWVIYALGRDGYLVTRSYYGYTKRESVRLFNEYMKEIAR